MSNFLLEAGAIDLIKNLAKKYSEKENIKKVIKRSKSNLFQLDFSQNDEIYSQIEVLFSDENLMILANESDNITGYDLVNWIEEKLRSYFNKYEVEEADREEFIRIFIDDFKANLKMIMPNKYMECFLAESRKETNEKLDKLMTRVYEQRNNVNNCKSFGKTIADIENRLVKASKYDIDLNFFDYGEKEVDNKILEAVDHNRIVYVKGRSREEALYYMLRVLKENGIYNVFVVDNEDDWKQVDSVHQDGILIPFFYSRNIMPAEINKTIFVLGEEDFEAKHKVIRIPNRIKRNLYDTLNKFIKDADKVHKIVEETMGVYSALKRVLFEGLNGKPKWIEYDKNFLVKVLLIGQFTNRKGDCEFIKQFTGLEFDEFILKVKELSSLEDPLLVEYNIWNGKKYRLVDPFNTWSLLKPFLCEKDMVLFQNLIIDVIMDDKAIKEINSWASDNGIYSNSLKKGIIRSLIYTSILFYHEENGINRIAKAIVDNICNKIKSKEEWMYICQFLPNLIEADVDSVFNKIEKSIISDDAGFWEMYKQQGDGLTGRNYYVSVLHSLEKLVFVKGYVPMVVDVLGYLADENIKYSISNSPEAILEKIFCVWHQEVPLNVEDKIRLLERFCKKHNDTSVVLIKKLLSNYGGIYCPLCKPDYLFYDIAGDLTSLEIITTKEKYFEIMIGLFGNNLSHWKKLFEDSIFIKKDRIDFLEKKLILLVKDLQIDDERKYEFESCLRSYLHSNRLYKNLTIEDMKYLEKVENIFNAIVYNNMIYSKLYAFEKGDIQSIHPEKFEDNYDFYKLQAYKNNEQQKILRENFIRTSISLNNLLEKCADVYETGSNIAVCTNEVDYDLLDVMYSNKKYNVLQGYINKIFSSKEEMLFNHFFMDVLSCNEDSVFRGLVLLAMGLNENIVDLAGMDDALEKYYWENNYSYIKFENAIFAEQCMVKALQYKNFRLAFFWARINEYSIDVYLNLLMKYLLESDNKLSNCIEAYDIKNIFKKIYAYDDMDDETREIIVLLEKSYIKVFGSEMKPKFLYKKLVEDPEFSAGLLATIYREEGVPSKENISDIDRNIANVNYSVLTYVKFCPACYDEKIDEREFGLWCERFLRFMANNNRERIAFNFLGKLFANSPKIENDIWPLPPICTAIEKYYNAGLEDGFVTQVHNNRGVHWCNHGVGEKELYHHYSCCADLIQLDFPKTAKMLRRIGKDYLKESVCEREKATYEY
ncbi:MAG: hypothetical protein IJC05_02705 [Phascolarctobacterium sp.]|nr:hypothetical protein [Phascolarctobacterium sp.]